MDRDLIQKITNDTRETYDQIAEEFSNTRHTLWPELLPILNYIKDGQKILDAGCGNGRILKLFSEKKAKDLFPNNFSSRNAAISSENCEGRLKPYQGTDKAMEAKQFAAEIANCSRKGYLERGLSYTGIDPSKKLIELAKKLHPNQGTFLTSQVEKLPFADNSFDHILMIAVLHHIPSWPLRQQALLELKRVLKPGGMFFLTNWNRWQPKFIFYIIKGLFVRGFDWGDFYLPWQHKAERYYHAFTKNSLRREIEAAGFKIIKHTTERDNFVTFCQKPQ